MGTSAGISLLLKNEKEYFIRTHYDGYPSWCGRHLWEWLRSLTPEDWDCLNEHLEKATWVEGHVRASAYALEHKKCNHDCPRPPEEHTMDDVMRPESYRPFKILQLVLKGEMQHVVCAKYDFENYKYRINFNSRMFYIWDGEEYINTPFTCKLARLIFESEINLEESVP